MLISNEILSFETRTLRVLAVLRTAPSHTKLDALRAIKNESFLTSFRMSPEKPFCLAEGLFCWGGLRLLLRNPLTMSVEHVRLQLSKPFDWRYVL